MTLFNVVLMTLAEIYGNYNLQNFASSNRPKHLMLGLAAYLGVIYFLIKSFGHGNMLWVTTMWEGMIIVLGSAFAFFYLGERFHHPIQYMGILLGIIAMLCVNYESFK